MAKLLIIKLGALGDVVMATSVIRQIQDHHAGEDLFVLTSPAFAGIFKDWPELKLMTFPRQGLWSSIQTLAWLRKQGFDRVYDLQSSDRTRIYCALSGIPVRIGNHPVFPYTLHPPDRYDGSCHIFQRLNQILLCAGISPAQETVFLPLNHADRQQVVHWLDQHQLSDKTFAIMHAGASHRHPEKCWPYYQQLALVLEQNQIKTVWIGSADDQDLNRSLAAITGIDASGLFSINQLGELARHAHFAVTNDSGPMHALSGSGVPVYAFFGPTNWTRNHALGQKQHVMTLQSEDVKGKKITGPESGLHNITCEQVLIRLQQEGLLER